MDGLVVGYLQAAAVLLVAWYDLQILIWLLGVISETSMEVLKWLKSLWR